MKYLFMILCLFLIVSQLQAEPGKSKYVEKMEALLAAQDTASSLETFKAITNSFKVVSDKEPEEWLPLYYYANNCVFMLYKDENADDDLKDKYLDRAEQAIEALLERNPNESEIHVLKAWYIIHRIGINPMVRSMLHMGKYHASIKKAIDLEPGNPRVRYIELSSKIGKAQFFGQSINEYCKEVNDLLNKWDDYELKSSIHPSWGKSNVMEFKKECTQ